MWSSSLCQYHDCGSSDACVWLENHLFGKLLQYAYFASRLLIHLSKANIFCCVELESFSIKKNERCSSQGGYACQPCCYFRCCQNLLSQFELPTSQLYPVGCHTALVIVKFRFLLLWRRRRPTIRLMWACCCFSSMYDCFVQLLIKKNQAELTRPSLQLWQRSLISM